ncbi:hypothetical protein ABH985_007094 [Bradyrhizobium ottawaense]
MLDRHQHRAAPFAAEAKALDQAAGDEQDRGPDAGGLVGRQESDRGGRHAHDQQRQIEHGLAADLVAVVPEHDAAERARDEAERIGRERQQRPHHGIEGRKEQLVEDQRRGGAVEEEVVPLDGRADQARGGDRDVRGLSRLKLMDRDRFTHLASSLVANAHVQHASLCKAKSKVRARCGRFAQIG